MKGVRAPDKVPSVCYTHEKIVQGHGTPDGSSSTSGQQRRQELRDAHSSRISPCVKWGYSVGNRLEWLDHVLFCSDSDRGSCQCHPLKQTFSLRFTLVTAP
jgi:hypothetical protein